MAMEPIKPLAPPDTSDQERSDVPRSLTEKLYALVRFSIPFLYLAVASGLAFLINFVEPPEPIHETERIEPVSAPAPEVSRVRMFSAEDLKREQVFREILISERGGRVPLLERRSLKMVGTIERGGSEAEAVVLQAFPDQASLRISLEEGGSVILGWDGKDAWRVEMDAGRGRRSTDPTVDDLMGLRAMSGCMDPLTAAFLRSEGRVISVEDSESKSTGKRVIRVTFQTSGVPGAQEVDLDPFTLETVRWAFSCPATDSLCVVHYGDYREVDGIEHPGRVEVWRDGDIRMVFRAETMNPNFGATGMIFDDPLADVRTQGSGTE